MSTDPDSDMHAHYMRALDEIYRLRQVVAYEAATLDYVLAFRTVPARARHVLNNAQGRLRASAKGWNFHDHLSAEELDGALKAAGAPTTLTRHQWENPDFVF